MYTNRQTSYLFLDMDGFYVESIISLLEAATFSIYIKGKVFLFGGEI